MSMMKPDISLIIEIMLFSEGFATSKLLSKKMNTLYHLMEQQLSKQDHYDFGLRSVKSVLTQAGNLKRADPDNAEELILLRSIRDMNVPKFVTQVTALQYLVCISAASRQYLGSISASSRRTLRSSIR